MTHVVIIGGSHAAAHLISSLRSAKFDGKITLVSQEPRLPYHRPPLSKAFLLGEQSEDRLPIFSEKIYAAMSVQQKLGRTAESVYRSEKTVRLDDGSALTYDALALCTGASVRRLSAPGADLPGIHYLRTLEDATYLKQSLKPGRALLVVGGGYIGLEAAASARKLGMDVTIIEAADRLLERVVAPEVSAFYRFVHEGEGVHIRTGSTVIRFEGEGRVSAAVLQDGTRLVADNVVVGIGVVPSASLAAEAGLAIDPVNGGIMVDDRCRTSDPHIFAAGDVTSFKSAIYGQQMLLESVQNATDQAKVIATALVGGDLIYASLPWFWSDQFDLKLKIAGLSAGYDTLITRGAPEDRNVSFLYLKEGRLIAADCVNRIPDFMAAKKIILSGDKMPLAQLADADFPLKNLLAE